MGNNKQPSLKRGIIYLIIVIVIIAIGFSLIGNSPSNKGAKENSLETNNIQLIY